MRERLRPVLVVDDNPATRYATGRVLQAAGFPTLDAATGGEAIDAVRHHPVCAVVLDINLPDVDGFEVCRHIRTIPGAELLPVVYLSATYVDAANKVYGLEVGADGYLTHPVEPAVLIATVRSLLRTRAAEATAARTEARFKAVFQQALNGAALLTADLEVLDANPAFARLVGHSHEDLMGMSAQRWLGEAAEAAEATGATIRESLAATGTWQHVVPVQRPDGSRRDLDWQLSTMGEPGVLLASVTDVTLAQQAARERELALQHESQAREEAERASRMKDEFLAVLSHELRTPLSAVLGWSQILRRAGHDPQRVASGLEVIERNARLQLRLISDLLDVSRIISGKLDLEFDDVDPAALVAGAVDAERPAADARGVRLDTTPAGPVAGAIRGDGARLQQVVTNLVGNAIKFTPPGGHVTVALGTANDGAVELRVSDTGVGIDPAFLPHLFERFRQQDATMRRSHGGLGLGLALVKHLVEMHGGTVSAESAGPGSGATFTVRLPQVRAVAAVARGTAASRASVSAPGELRGVRVVVVDDERDSRELVSGVLTEWGAEVQQAASAAEARALVGRRAPDVLISDIGMPLEDGYALLRSLRERGHTPLRLPAVALTAFARAEDRDRALAAGYQLYLSKPVDLAALVGQVAALARASRPVTPSEHQG